jgi:molybdopterin converting factor subunit 1
MITVKYFANLKTIAGKEEDQFQINRETTLLQLCDEISKTSPTLGKMVREKKIVVSVNMNMAALDAVIRDGDEVALLPPFSGGLDISREESS